MNIEKRFCLLVSVNLFSAAIFAQDRIYTDHSVINGKAVEVSSTVVKYQITGKGQQTYILPITQVRILFNHNGFYLIPSKLDSAGSGSKRLLEQFLASDTARLQNDQVFTIQKGRIDCHIVSEDSTFLVVSAAPKIDKREVAVVIYKNGNQKVYGKVDSAADILWAVQLSSLQRNYPGAALATNPTPMQSEPTQTMQTAKIDSARQAAFAAIAGNISRKEFEDKAIQKTNKLNEYLKILCSKSASYESSNEAIDQAVSLFVNENALVETSSIKKNSVSHYKIREYLTRVKLFKYDKIEIEWTHVQYVSDLKLGADGNFYGVVTFEQVFRGYRDNQLVYSDITRKNENVVLKTYNKNYEGATKTIWDVLLSDIGVVYTKSSDTN